VAIQSEMYEGGKFCGKTVVVTRKSVRVVSFDLEITAFSDALLDFAYS
jgi:hypothetical protein